MSDDSLDLWIERMNNGEAGAVEHVLVAYEPLLRIAVRKRLGPKLRSKVDSMDIVQSVFANVIKGFHDGGWRFAGRPQLQAFLRRIAWRRLADRYQENRKALGREQSLEETRPQSLPQAETPRPSQVAQGREFLDRLLRSCPPAHREVVRLRMNGYRMGEIAAQTGLHEGSVRRIIYDLARRMAVTGGPARRPADGDA